MVKLLIINYFRVVPVFWRVRRASEHKWGVSAFYLLIQERQYMLRIIIIHRADRQGIKDRKLYLDLCWCNIFPLAATCLYSLHTEISQEIPVLIRFILYWVTNWRKTTIFNSSLKKLIVFSVLRWLLIVIISFLCVKASLKACLLNLFTWICNRCICLKIN